MTSPGFTVTQEIRSAIVYTHKRPEVTRDVVRTLIDTAERIGVELRFDSDEAAKHGLDESHNADKDQAADLCIVLGGDGTTLRFLRQFAGTDVPVFSVNCGRVGFLATVDRANAEEGVERALSG